MTEKELAIQEAVAAERAREIAQAAGQSVNAADLEALPALEPAVLKIPDAILKLAHAAGSIEKVAAEIAVIVDGVLRLLEALRGVAVPNSELAVLGVAIDNPAALPEDHPLANLAPDPPAAAPAKKVRKRAAKKPAAS